MKKDITQYSDLELNLLFYNDEYLYMQLEKAVRISGFDHLINICDKMFIYRQEQLDELRDTFNDELAAYTD